MGTVWPVNAGQNCGNIHYFYDGAWYVWKADHAEDHPEKCKKVQTMRGFSDR